MRLPDLGRFQAPLLGALLLLLPALSPAAQSRARDLLEDYKSVIAESPELDGYTKNDHLHKAEEMIRLLPDLF